MYTRGCSNDVAAAAAAAEEGNRIIAESDLAAAGVPEVLERGAGGVIDEVFSIAG